MRKVYAVSAGAYSDYRVVAIFTTEELAKDFMTTVTDTTYNDIEEYALNPKSADLVRRGYSVWAVLMTQDGTVVRTHNGVNSYDVTDSEGFYWWRGPRGEPVLRSVAWAKTEKQAIKIANDRRTQLIASGRWGEPECSNAEIVRLDAAGGQSERMES